MLDELYNSVLPKVRSYILNNSGTVDEANDVFQDAVMIFYKKVKMGETDSTMNITAYLVTVAKNLWINKVKRDARIQYTDELKEELIDSSLLSSMISEEREIQVKQVLGQLGERCFQLLNYIFYQDYSLAEVTAIMGFSSAEVAHTNHYRCKKKLKALVQGDASFKTLLQRGVNG